MKIPIKKTKKIGDAPWHQDFRNPETLPDIKVIRTQFFVNFLAIVIPLFVAVMWIQQELFLGAVRDDIAKMEDEKSSLSPSNQELVELSRDFMKESSKIESLDAYYNNLFSVSDYLETIAGRVSEDMVLTSMELKKASRINGDSVVEIWESRIAGYVSHENKAGIANVNHFVEQIGKEELLASHLDAAFLENLARDQLTDTLNFVVSISMSDTGKTEGGGK